MIILYSVLNDKVIDIKMKLVLFLVAFALISCACEPEDSYCCKPEQGVLDDSENLCVSTDTNNNTIKTPAKLACQNVSLIPDGVFNYTITDDGRLIAVTSLELHVDSDL